MARSLVDTYRHQGLRKKLVALLKQQGIKEQLVLDAIATVPRHQYLDSVFDHKAYENIALPIDEEQTISQPYTVAFQTEILDIQEGDKVLEIGTGCGYQTAILAEMQAEVYTIERFRSLSESAKEQLLRMGYTDIHFFHGDGFKGLPLHAPFQKIIVTAAPTAIPEALVAQLEIGGKMIVPIDKGLTHKMTLIEKISNTEHNITELSDFRFVPMLKGKVS